MKRRMLLILALLLLSGLAHAEFPEKVTIGDKTIECGTVEEIRKLGFECEDIPWKDNAARLYIDAANAHKRPDRPLEDLLNKSATKLDFGGAEKEAAKYFEENAQAFDLLKQADRMSRCQIPIARSKSVNAIPLVHLRSFQDFGRDLKYRAAFEFAQGEHAKAIDDCFLGLRLGRRVATDQFLISGIVGIAIQNMTVKVLQAMVASGKLADGELKSLGERLAKEDLAPNWATGVMGERLGVLDALSEIQAGRMNVLDMVPLPPGEEEPDPEAFRKKIGLDPETARKNLTAFYAFLDDQAEKPFFESFFAVRKFFEDKVAKWDPVTRRLATPFDKALVAYGRCRVSLDAICIRVALERFHLAGEVYPDLLAETLPTYLDKLPLDPFSGNPYGYRLEADGNLTLWSVGENLRDDGGKGDPNNPWAGPDYVFTSRRQAPEEPPK